MLCCFSLVVEELKNVLGFWLDLGIDGVRMDAISHLIEDDQLLDEPKSGNPEAADELDWKYLEHVYTNDQNLTRNIVQELTLFVKDNYGPQKFIVLETDLDVPAVMEYYDCGDIPFNFNLGRHITDDKVSAGKIMNEVNLWMNNMPSGEVANWVTGSHDIKRIASRVSEKFIDHMNMLLLMLPGNIKQINDMYPYHNIILSTVVVKMFRSQCDLPR